MYSSNAQPTGTNRPRACHTNPQPTPQTHLHPPNTSSCGGRHLRVRVHINRPTPHPQCFHGRVCGVHRVTAAIASGKHPVPSRTRKLSLTAPMVLQPRGCGRVGRRRTNIRFRATRKGRPEVFLHLFCPPRGHLEAISRPGVVHRSAVAGVPPPAVCPSWSPAVANVDARRGGDDR